MGFFYLFTVLLAFLVVWAFHDFDGYDFQDHMALFVACAIWPFSLMILSFLHLCKVAAKTSGWARRKKKGKEA